MLAIIAALFAQLAAIAPDSVYSQRIEPGQAVTAMDGVGLCVSDDTTAMHDMDMLAAAMLTTRAAKVCTTPINGVARIVRGVSRRCLRRAGAEWCAVEAHAVIIRQRGQIRYAVLLITEDQLD